MSALRTPSPAAATNRKMGSGLKVDGLAKPRGETIKAMDATLFRENDFRSRTVKPGEGPNLAQFASAGNILSDAAAGAGPESNPQPAEDAPARNVRKPEKTRLEKLGAQEPKSDPDRPTNKETDEGPPSQEGEKIRWTRVEMLAPGSQRPVKFESQGPIKVELRTATLPFDGLR